jgi:YbbR domain-containing protein
LIVASDLPKTVPVRIKGTGKSLIYFDLKNISDRNRRYILVNLANLPRGKHEIALDRNKVSLGTVNDVEVVSVNENSGFTISLDREIKKSIPVKLDMDSLPELKISRGYTVVGNPLAQPELLTVSGPEETVSALSSIQIKSFVRNSISDTNRMLTARVDTGMYRFVKIEPNEVNLFFTVEPLTENMLSGIPVQMKNFPRNSNLECKPDSITVTIKGPESKVSKITRKSVIAAVQYKTYLDAEGGEIKPEITLQPDIPGVSITMNPIRIVPREQK